jgi:hypothetical protein
VNLSKATLTLPPLGSASFDAVITANDTLPDRSLYGGYITLTPQGAGTVMSVPYAGFKGRLPDDPGADADGQRLPVAGHAGRWQRTPTSRVARATRWPTGTSRTS